MQSWKFLPADRKLNNLLEIWTLKGSWACTDFEISFPTNYLLIAKCLINQGVVSSFTKGE